MRLRTRPPLLTYLLTYLWTVEKPKVSTSKILMAVLGRLTPAWSSRTVMGRRLVKKMAKIFFSEPGCQKYRGG